jgi:hypothetical protein
VCVEGFFSTNVVRREVVNKSPMFKGFFSNESFQQISPEVLERFQSDPEGAIRRNRDGAVGEVDRGQVCQRMERIHGHRRRRGKS